MGLVSEFLFFFEYLAECEERSIRELVASIAVALNLLEKLGRDSSPTVRAAVARNPIAPAELLERLAEDKHSRVRAGAAKKSSASPQLLGNASKKGRAESQSSCQKS